MLGSDPTEPINIGERKEESTAPESEKRPTEPLIPLNAAASVSITVVQIDLKEAIVFMIVLAIVLYLVMRVMRSAKTFPAS